MWDLVENPEDRFSHNEAHIIIMKFYMKVEYVGHGLKECSSVSNFDMLY